MGRGNALTSLQGTGFLTQGDRLRLHPLLFHGFADDMDGAGDLMKRLAAELATNGIASLRVNFRGEGDRHRTNITSTFHSRIEDGATALAFVRKQPGVANDRIGVLGWSLGGATAVEVAARDPDRLRCLVLWSSSSGNLHTAFTTGNYSLTAAQAASNGVGSLTTPGWKTVTLRREFFDSFRGFDTDVALARYPGAFLSVRGTEDFLPQHEMEFLKLAKGRPSDAILIGGADHRLAPAGAVTLKSQSVPRGRRVRSLSLSAVPKHRNNAATGRSPTGRPASLHTAGIEPVPSPSG